MTMYQVDAQEISLAGANAGQTAIAIRESVNSMMAQLQTLQSSWIGGASASFQSVIADWHATQVQVETSLDNVATALGQASTTYLEAEDNAAALFAG